MISAIRYKGRDWEIVACDLWVMCGHSHSIVWSVGDLWLVGNLWSVSDVWSVGDLWSVVDLWSVSDVWLIIITLCAQGCVFGHVCCVCMWSKKDVRLHTYKSNIFRNRCMLLAHPLYMWPEMFARSILVVQRRLYPMLLFLWSSSVVPEGSFETLW